MCYGSHILIFIFKFLGDLIRELANECGFEIDEEGSAVIDHLNFDIEDDGKVRFYFSSFI